LVFKTYTGDPDDLVDTSNEGPVSKFYATEPPRGVLKDWRSVTPLILLNLYYDMTPAKYITMVACEHGLIPSTLVTSVMHGSE
jgi:translation initiation factor 2B subunit (eIF-2B alpha/beta/delta family)